MTGISGHSYIVNKFLETYMRILGPNRGAAGVQNVHSQETYCIILLTMFTTS